MSVANPSFRFFLKKEVEELFDHQAEAAKVQLATYFKESEEKEASLIAGVAAHKWP